MSPTALATLRRIERDTRALAVRVDHADYGDPIRPTARYPRDYYRPAELLRRWRGPGRFFYR